MLEVVVDQVPVFSHLLGVPLLIFAVALQVCWCALLGLHASVPGLVPVDPAVLHLLEVFAPGLLQLQSAVLVAAVFLLLVAVLVLLVPGPVLQGLLVDDPVLLVVDDALVELAPALVAVLDLTDFLHLLLLLLAALALLLLVAAGGLLVVADAAVLGLPDPALLQLVVAAPVDLLLLLLLLLLQ